LIAGIQDLQVGPSDVDGGAPPADGSAGDVRDSTSPFDARTPDASIDAAGSEAQSTDAPVADAVPVDGTTGDTSPADGTIVDASTPDVTAVDSGPPSDGSTTSDAGYTTVLIDDMESTLPSPGWLDGPNTDGTWYVFDDGTDGGVLTPTAGSTADKVISVITPAARGTSVHAARVIGNSGFTNYGGGMGFNAGSTPVVFSVLDRPTALPTSGGTCDASVCSDYYQVTLTLTSTWTPYTIPYSLLHRPSYATTDTRPFDPAHMIGCQFQAPPREAFDLWIDDISFIDPVP
jgi:hypothetical protein